MIYENPNTFEEFDFYVQKQIAKLPVCVECGEHIQDEYLYIIEEDPMCEECAEKWLKRQRRRIDDQLD